MLRLRTSQVQQLSRFVRSRSQASANVAQRASMSTNVPSVADVTVKLNFVDYEGKRQTVPGRIGQTIHDVATMHGIEVGPCSVGGAVSRVNSDTWTEDLYGEGATSGYDHVLLVGKGADSANVKCVSEVEMLNEYWDPEDISPNSRLASMVVVNKDMDGMTVFVPDALPWEAP
mmetsp:Transcript_21018/g.32067  ORF Transcript_21018/g.32067 Transcript_21018/m.32067 type:complete len:173 (+) Transcript_21018:106-624(+)|eukprot:CAMPEP_0196801414 /NCGR_PEP_ID=MMETSP1362-20130617/1158_1 /TAXON_ID=163516 /ORGANISM="Leptocylindrus danicus, Strain CCMP1856" /LENGTH=172 /DNA_ID=CAMNT_0042172353 /DNA_START=78 /DNA_END=596 /DNA_ORIENTATION=+